VKVNPWPSIRNSSLECSRQRNSQGFGSQRLTDRFARGRKPEIDGPHALYSNIHLLLYSPFCWIQYTSVDADCHIRSANCDECVCGYHDITGSCHDISQCITRMFPRKISERRRNHRSTYDRHHDDGAPALRINFPSSVVFVWSSDKGLFEKTISARSDPNVFHVYLGYAGWKPVELS
jgi:hypothetical protein